MILGEHLFAVKVILGLGNDLYKEKSLKILGKFHEASQAIFASNRKMWGSTVLQTIKLSLALMCLESLSLVPSVSLQMEPFAPLLCYHQLGRI